MTEKEIKMKINEIYRNMLINAKKMDGYRITELYREYLKLSILLNPNNPTFMGDLYEYSRANCYCYALGLKYPMLFYKLYKSKTNNDFPHNIGFVSNNEYEENPKKILEFLYEDLEELKIKYFNSSVNQYNIHDGYKIALYLSHDYQDFHFFRQNNSGIWSEKTGYLDVIRMVEPPKNNIDNYELIQVLELVKPKL